MGNYLLKGAAKSDAARNRFEGTRRTATERSGNKREWAWNPTKHSVSDFSASNYGKKSKKCKNNIGYKIFFHNFASETYQVNY